MNEDNGDQAVVHTMNITRCKELVDLERDKAALKKRLKDVEKKIKAKHGPILADLLRCGMKNVSLEDGTTLYKKRGIFCGKAEGVSMPEICAALTGCEELAWAVEETYGVAKLKEWLGEKETERASAGELPCDPSMLLPESIRKLLKVSEVTSIVVLGK